MILKPFRKISGRAFTFGKLRQKPPETNSYTARKSLNMHFPKVLTVVLTFGKLHQKPPKTNSYTAKKSLNMHFPKVATARGINFWKVAPKTA